MPGIAARDSAQQGNGDLCGVNQPGSCAHADRDSTEFVGVQGGAVSEREKLASVANGVQVAAKAILGQRLWARGYWVASSGNVTDEVWQEYIKNRTPPEPDEDFHVV